MNKQIDNPEGERHSGSGKGERLLAIGQKLGIAIPAGLLLFCGVNASAMSRDGATPAFASDAARENEVARHLTEITSNPGGVLLADKDNPLHGNTHVDTNSPDVHSDYSDSGKHTNTHGNVHTNTHGDANRY
jgi:hypothetical protein